LHRIVFARNADEILALRSRWEFLQARCHGTLFQSFKWNWLAANSFADRESPHVIFAETSNGTALLPLCINLARKTLSCLGDVLFDYRDVLTLGEEDALIAAWEAAARLGLPFSSGGLQASSRKAWAGFQLDQFYGTPVVRASEISADCFSANHSRSASRLRRLERMGVALREYSPAPASLVRWVYEQKAMQPAEAGENVFCDPRRVAFMAAVVKEEPYCEEVFTLEADGKCIAAILTLREDRCRRFYTVWFDQQWSRYSPGISLIFEVTRRSLAEGLSCDYMTGEQDYKMRFATSVEPLFWVNASAEQLRDLVQTSTGIAA
jgi:CelD/BcsL family acetyltransferase involved in cellulose biosynthesis